VKHPLFQQKQLEKCIIIIIRVVIAKSVRRIISKSKEISEKDKFIVWKQLEKSIIIIIRVVIAKSVKYINSLVSKSKEISGKNNFIVWNPPKLSPHTKILFGKRTMK